MTEVKLPAKIIDYVVPARLYRYRSLRRIGQKNSDILDREMKAIERNHLWCSDFNSLNDPMEGAFVATMRVKRHSRYKDALQTIKNGKVELGLCAFSETNNNELMWAHYSDEFGGICIRYNFRRLLKGLSNSYSFSRISYAEHPPKMGKPDGDFSLKVRRIMSTKNHRWLYEREWRMFAPLRGKNEYRSSKKAPVVAAVYLGFRMDQPTRETIKQRMANVGVRTYVMIVKNYGLQFEQI